MTYYHNVYNRKYVCLKICIQAMRKILIQQFSNTKHNITSNMPNHSMNIFQITNIFSYNLFHIFSFWLNYFSIMEPRINKTHKLKIYCNYKIYYLCLRSFTYDSYEMDIIISRTKLCFNNSVSYNTFSEHIPFKENFMKKVWLIRLYILYQLRKFFHIHMSPILKNFKFCIG